MPILAADPIEHVKPILRYRAGAFVGSVSKRDAVVGQDGVEFIGKGGDHATQEHCAGQHGGARMQLDIGVLA